MRIFLKNAKKSAHESGDSGEQKPAVRPLPDGQVDHNSSVLPPSGSLGAPDRQITAAKLTPSSLSARRELFGLCTGVMLAHVATSMNAPLVPLQLLALGASPGLIGILVSVTSVGSLLFAVPSGMLVRRFGTRTLLAFACLLGAGGCLLVYLLPVIGILFFGLSLFEIGKIVTAVASQGHVANLGRSRDTGLDFGWYGSAAAFGNMIGPYLAGLTIDVLGHRLTWAIIGAILLLTGLVFSAVIGAGLVGPTNSAKTRFDSGRMKRLLNIPAIVAIMANFVIVFADGSRTTFFPVYANELNFSATSIGAFMSLLALAEVFTRALIRRYLQLCGGRFPALLISMTALSIGIGLTPFCRSSISLASVSILVGSGKGFATPLCMATVADGMRPEDRPVALGLRLSGNRLARLINPLFFGLIIQRFNTSVAFWAGGVVLLAVIAPMFIWWWQDRLILMSGHGGNKNSDRGA